MTSWSSVVIRVLFEFVKIEVLFIASTRLFFIAKQRSTTGWGGGYFGVKRIGMTIGNPRKLP